MSQVVQAANGPALRVYWQPGCSSCVKVKEFLRTQDVPFVSVNVLEHEGAFEELEQLGARGFPVVARGTEFVFGQSLSDVATFIRKDVRFERLPTPELVNRMFYFLDASLKLTPQIPAHLLQHRPIPNRDRSLMGLAYHSFQVPHSFLETVENGRTDLMKYFDTPPPADVSGTGDVARYGEQIKARLHGWWDHREDRDLDWEVETFYGPQAVPAFLERSTWHTAQHVRQVEAALDALNVALSWRIDTEAYRGLPMPDGLWT
jgi:glutaredoxin